MSELKFTEAVRLGHLRVLWAVLGHEDDAGSECGTCGTKFGKWREKIETQRGALQEDCCTGFTFSKPAKP